jgi:hypothetical protein
MPEFSDHRIVDRATSYVGGNATLFVYDGRPMSKKKTVTGRSARNSRLIIPPRPHCAAAKPTKDRQCCSATVSTQPISRCSVPPAR